MEKPVTFDYSLIAPIIVVVLSFLSFNALHSTMKSGLVQLVFLTLIYHGVDAFVAGGSRASKGTVHLAAFEGIPSFFDGMGSAVVAANGNGAGSMLETPMTEIKGGAMIDTFSSLMSGSEGTEPLISAGAVAVILAAVAFAGKSASEATNEGAAFTKKKTKPSEPNDVSIPYDATALLAYEAWRAEVAEDGADTFDDALFSRFKKLYYEKAVAEVVMKSKTRKFMSLVGSTNKPAAPKTETTAKKEPVVAAEE